MLSPDWFVDPVNGNDDTGDGLSFATAFATTLKAVSEATSGDTIALCATGTEMIDTQLNLADDGLNKSDMHFIGYKADGSGPLTSGFYTLDGTNLADSMIRDKTFKQYFYRIRITNSQSAGILTAHTTAQYFMNLCSIDNCDGVGFVSASVSSISFFNRCLIYNNGGGGIVQSLNGRGCVCIRDSIILNNGGNGIYLTGDVNTVYNCIVAKNTLSGVRLTADNGVHWSHDNTIAQNTIYGNGESGIYIETIRNVVDKNTLVNNAAYGIRTVDGVWDGGWPTYNSNHFYGNNEEMNVDPALGEGIVRGDPLFADVDADDYVPQPGSPLLLSDGAFIGALSPTGSGVVNPFEFPFIR